MMASKYSTLIRSRKMENNNTDWEKKLEELEREINQGASGQEVSVESPLPRHNETSHQLKQILHSLQALFASLPPVGKLIVAAVGAITAFSLLSTVLQIVTSLLSLAILTVVLYCVYRFFFTPGSSD